MSERSVDPPWWASPPRRAEACPEAVKDRAACFGSGWNPAGVARSSAPFDGASPCMAPRFTAGLAHAGVEDSMAVASFLSKRPDLPLAWPYPSDQQDAATRRAGVCSGPVRAFRIAGLPRRVWTFPERRRETINSHHVFATVTALHVTRIALVCE